MDYSKISYIEAEKRIANLGSDMAELAGKMTGLGRPKLSISECMKELRRARKEIERLSDAFLDML